MHNKVNGVLFLWLSQAFFCGRSEYFNALLRDHFSETTADAGTPVFTIKDVPVEVFCAVVYYIYTNVVQVGVQLFGIIVCPKTGVFRCHTFHSAVSQKFLPGILHMTNCTSTLSVVAIYKPTFHHPTYNTCKILSTLLYMVCLQGTIGCLIYMEK